MVTAVSGSSGAGAYAGPAVSSARGLDAELARSEVQLSDWTHCVSAKTPHGKEKIAEISAKVSDIKARMKRAEEAPPPRLPTAPTAPLAAASSGRLLDVYA